MLSMGTRASNELSRGDMSQILIKGSNGFVVLMQAGPHAVLVAIARKDAKLGLIFYDLDRSSEAIGEVLA
jgi:predicted regulator of Ras-like GTPase activity (Roadblock/LC7/MglB family)